MTDTDAILDDEGRFKKLLTAPENRGVLQDVPVGTFISRNTLPPGILIIENYLDQPTCRGLLEMTKQAKGVRTRIGDDEKLRKGNTSFKYSDHRITDRVPLGAENDRVNDIYRALYREQIGPYFDVVIERYESPQLLRYSAGGKYHPHSDAEIWDKELGRWIRSQDRDYSTLLYLDSDFEGGQLIFPNFNFQITPKAGLLVSFPSDNRYAHGAEQITSGIRHVLVSWACAKGTQRVNQTPTPGTVFM